MRVKKGDVVRLSRMSKEPDWYALILGRLGKVAENVDDHGDLLALVPCLYLYRNQEEICYPYLHNIDLVPDGEDELAAQRMLDELSK